MGGLQLVERSYDGIDVGEIGKKSVGGVLEDFFV